MCASFTKSCRRWVFCILAIFLTSLCTPPLLNAAAPAITAPSTPIGPTEVRALTVRFPQVSFNNATLDEAVECLRTTRGCDPEPGTDSHVNIVIIDDAPDARISLDLKDITLHASLHYCAELAGMTVTYRDHAALVHLPRHKPQIGDLDSPLMNRAKAMVLPHVIFHGATVKEAVTHLREKSLESDPGHQGINIVLEPGSESVRPIALNLRRIPLSEVLCYVAAMTNVRLAISDNAFVFSPRMTATKASKPTPDPFTGVSLLWEVTKLLPEGERLTSCKVKDGHLIIIGESSRSAPGGALRQDLKSSPVFAGFRWEFPAPVIKANGNAVFRAEGIPVE